MALVILGGGGHASDVLAVLEATIDEGADPGPLAVADDRWERPERFGNRTEIKMIESIAAGVAFGRFLLGIGYPGSRRKVHDLAVGWGGKPAAPIIHPHTSIGADLRLAEGVVVMGQTWLSPLVELGAHTHVGYGSTIGHDTRVGEFGAVMPGARIGGDVTIGDGVLVGAGAIVLQGLTIGADATIGAGAVVTTDVAVGSTVVGVPAKPIG